jgi:MoaA/NifB/PqqE/SkfB family radical SAM enzyme
MIDFARRKAVCREVPREWMIESTNRCNLACPMCTRHLVPFRSEDMSLDLFRHLVGEHPEAEAIWPYGFGEPLLHPQIFDFISIAKRFGKTVCISTNATLLTRDRGKGMLDSGLDYLILAVDGAGNASYSANRYPASLVDTERLIDEFLAQKMGRRSRVHVTVQMVLLKNNAGEVRSFRRRWRRPGVDTVRVRNDLSGLPGISLQNRQVRSRTKRPCFFLWRGPIFVQAAGTVLPCPYYHGSRPFGDLRAQSGLEAWNSEAMQALRMAHVRRELSGYPVCLRCPRHQPHPILAEASFFVNTHHIRRLLPWLERLQTRLGITLFE